MLASMTSPPSGSVPQYGLHCSCWIQSCLLRFVWKWMNWISPVLWTGEVFKINHEASSTITQIYVFVVVVVEKHYFSWICNSGHWLFVETLTHIVSYQNCLHLSPKKFNRKHWKTPSSLRWSTFVSWCGVRFYFICFSKEMFPVRFQVFILRQRYYSLLSCPPLSLLHSPLASKLSLNTSLYLWLRYYFWRYSKHSLEIVGRVNEALW